MKKIKKFSSFLSVCLSLSVVLGNFSLSTALAYEKKGVNFEQVRTETKLDNSEVTFNKINSTSRAVSNLSQGSSIIQKEKIGLEKSQQIEGRGKGYVEGEVLVKYKNSRINLQTVSGRTAALNFASSKSLEKKEDLRKVNISVLRIKDSKTVEQKVAELKNDPNIEYAQPNFRYYPTVINTNDTNKGFLWGLDNTGQTIDGSYGNITGTNDADIDAPEAWTINEGTNASIIVAVIDSGVAYNHPDLLTNMWDGTSCKDENGIAILEGCNHGYDYEDGDNTPLPTSDSHGTHIAGTIAAEKNNTKGIIGVAPQAKIMAIKLSLITSNIIKGINFAKQNNAKIINASWASTNNDQSLKDAIASFPGLFIAAAGNESTNNESIHNYPSDYNLDNIVSVAATDQKDSLATFSNYGTTSVDVGAPGTNIYSTNFIDEDFSGAAIPTFSGTMYSVSSGGWRTGTWANPSDKNAQANSSYVNNDNSILVLSNPVGTDAYDQNVYLRFYLLANIEPPIENTCFDYFLIEVDNNDNNWETKAVGCGNLGSSFQIVNLGLGKSNMRVRFVWHTDSTVIGPQIPIIDDIQISNTHSYRFSDGTSMAAPHVAGLAALIWGTKPSLTSADVKNSILNTGDPLSSLATTTVTGKRINAFNALNNITTPPIISNVQTATTTATSTAVIWSTDVLATSKVAYSTTTPVSSTIVSTSTLVTNHSMKLTGLSASTTYYFYAESSDKYGNIATSSEQSFITLSIPDTTPPVITLNGSSTVDILVGDVYTDPGATALDNIDGDITVNIIVVNPVSTSTIGTYIITYNVSDAAGNPATEVTRTVNVAANPDITAAQVAIDQISALPTPANLVLGNATAVTNAREVYTSLTETQKGLVTNLAVLTAAETQMTSLTTATSKVTELETAAANDLTIEANLTAAESAVTAAYSTFESVIAGGAKTELANRFNSASGIVATAAVAADKAALVDSLIQGANPNLSNITTALTNPLPANGSHGSSITYVSSNTAVVSNDGQTINRPVYVDGDTTVNLTATIGKGIPIVCDLSGGGGSGGGGGGCGVAVGTTKIFSLTVLKLPASAIATITSGTYNVSTGETTSETITNIPFGTNKAAFLAALTKGEANQTWNDTGIADLVVTGNTLVVTAEDGITTVIYTVTAALNYAKAITAFSFSEGSGTINEGDHTIAVIVPYGTDVTVLTPTIVITGTSVSPLSGLAQDFTNPVTYTVTAEDSSTQTYTVTVTVAANTVANILSFDSTAPAAIGVISGTNITLTVPFGTNLTDLPITIVLSPGASVLPIAGNTTFIDGVATTYTVTAQDNVTTQNYLVTVIVAANSAKDITSFNFAGLTPIVTGVISGTDITLNVPYGTDVTALVPTIIITGASVNPASDIAQDFTTPVTYTVTAADNTTQVYTVMVIVAQPSDLTVLTAAIAIAQNKYDTAIEGNLPGQYPAPLKANLQAAINTASAITIASAQSVVDAAVITLNDAIATFEAGIVPPDTTLPVITLNGLSVMDIYAGSTYIDAGATALDNVDGNITMNIVTVNPANSAAVGTYTITYNVFDAAGNSAVQVTRTVNVLPVSSSAQLLGENTIVSTSTPEILVGDNDAFNSIITIPDSVTNATINLTALTTSTATSTTATIQGAMTINASTTIGTVKVEIPAGIQIVAGTSTWNGIINVPQVKENSTVTVTPDSGNTAAVSSVIEIGYGDTLLNFNKAVRMNITSQAGKYVGYSRNGIFTPITNICSADSQAIGDALAEGAECKINAGSDLIIWTKHFTNFVTYTQTAIPPVVVVSSGGGGGGGGGSYTPPLALTKGDINNDKKVDKYDFSLMMANWGKIGSNTSDLNNDGKVDKYDFALLMLNWSK